MENTNHQDLQDSLSQYLESTPAMSPLSGFFQYLTDCEDQALALITYLKNPNEPPPQVPEKGSIEFGFVLYWIHHPPLDIQEWLNKHPVLKTILQILQKEAPPTRINQSEYEMVIHKIETTSVPWDDGTLIGTKKYEQLDPLWMLAALNYAINLVDPGSLASFPNKAVYQGTLSRKPGRTGDPVIGIIGDWGTGFYQEENGIDCSAKRVIEAIQQHELDYLVHLGDVYYSGTYWRPIPGEEEAHFLNIWPDQGFGRNFTLNSNHEMTGDDHGYFDQALGTSSPFRHQNGMSYFSLKYGSWLILGLDSAYYSDKQNGDKLYMDGAIGTNIFNQQIQWLNQFREHPGKVMILSHHNACDVTTAFTNLLFNQVHSALGKMPDLWYWGHVHNGIVYQQLFLGNSMVYIPTKGRCCGHASIPFGNGWGLENNSNINYYAHTHDDLLPANSPRVKNGYALVTLHPDGGFTEAFYETGKSSAVWMKKWSADE